MIVLYIFLIILALLIIISLIPIRCMFRANAEGAEIKIRYSLFKYTLLPSPKKEEKPKQDKPQKSENKEKKLDIKKQLSILKEAKDDILSTLGQVVRYIAHHAITIENLNISAKIGTGDPADTGIICGAAYSFIYQLIGTLSAAMKLKDHNVIIDPDFDNSAFSAGIYVQLRTRLAHLIILALFLAKLLIKYKYIQTRYERSSI